jgi:hypothetical protein
VWQVNSRAAQRQSGHLDLVQETSCWHLKLRYFVASVRCVSFADASAYHGDFSLSVARRVQQAMWVAGACAHTHGGMLEASADGCCGGRAWPVMRYAEVGVPSAPLGMRCNEVVQALSSCQ